MTSHRSIDARIAALAGVQGGYIHREQLTHLSLSPRAIRYRVERGRLIVAYYHVYAVGHEPTHPHERAKGALLAAGPRSALGDISAGAYYGIFRHWQYPLHVTVPTDRRISGLVIHRNRRLAGRDIITPQPNLRVVSPLIALIDAAPHLTEKRRRRVVNEVRLEHRIPLGALKHALDRFPRHPGVPLLRPILATSQSQPNRSDWEDEWPAFAARYDLPDYLMNQHVAGHRTDVLFIEEQLIVELDGWAAHQTHEAFIRDRDQDAHILATTGIPTVRITYERFHERPAQEAGRLHAILQRRRSELALAAGRRSRGGPQLLESRGYRGAAASESLPSGAVHQSAAPD